MSDPRIYYAMLGNQINRDLRAKITDLKDYQALISGTLDVQKDKATERFKPSDSESTEEEKYFLDYMNKFYYRRHYSRYQDLFLKALIISIYSAFESIFVSTCSFIIDIHNEQISFDGISKKQKNITRYKNYLVNHRSFSFNKKLWKKIEDLSDLRNILAHSDGDVTPKFNKTAERLEKHNRHIKIVGSWLEIDFQYVDEVTSTVQEALINFQDQLHSKSLTLN